MAKQTLFLVLLLIAAINASSLLRSVRDDNQYPSTTHQTYPSSTSTTPSTTYQTTYPTTTSTAQPTYPSSSSSPSSTQTYPTSSSSTAQPTNPTYPSETTTEQETTSTTEETTTESSGCPPQESFDCPQPYVAPGLYPTADNCSQFWQCFDYPRPGVRQTCARQNATALLYFNNNTKTCDYQANVDCTACQPSTSPSTTPSTVTYPTYPSSSTTVAYPTSSSTQSYPSESTTEEEETTTPSGCPGETTTEPPVDVDELCKGCNKAHLVANPNSDKSYVYCGDNGYGNEVRECSEGLRFDKKYLTCDYAGLVKYGGRGY